jgi:hypothetical protein
VTERRDDLAKVAEIERHAQVTKDEGLLARARAVRAKIERSIVRDGRTDSELAEQFLFGRFTKTKGKVRVEYLGDSDEDEARRALVRILRGDSPPNEQILRSLAALFDERSCYDRKLVFASRRKGAPGLAVEDRLTIARTIGILLRDGKSQEAAFDEAGRVCSVSAETARNHWREFSDSPIVPQSPKRRRKKRSTA